MNIINTSLREEHALGFFLYHNNLTSKKALIVKNQFDR